MTIIHFPTVLGHARGFRVWGGLFVLMVGWLIAPQSVAASCGDYLAHPHHPLAVQTMINGHGRDSELPVPARPCNGPSCRRSDAPAPLPVPAPVQWTGGERWATMLHFEVVLPTATTQLSHAADEFSTSVLPQRLDRPPKAA